MRRKHLGDIAKHVIEAESIAWLRANFVRPVVGIVAVPRHKPGDSHNVAGNAVVAVRRGAGPAGVLPLRIRRQEELIPRLVPHFGQKSVSGDVARVAVSREAEELVTDDCHVSLCSAMYVVVLLPATDNLDLVHVFGRPVRRILRRRKVAEVRAVYLRPLRLRRLKHGDQVVVRQFNPVFVVG